VSTAYLILLGVTVVLCVWVCRNPWVRRFAGLLLASNCALHVADYVTTYLLLNSSACIEEGNPIIAYLIGQTSMMSTMLLCTALFLLVMSYLYKWAPALLALTFGVRAVVVTNNIALLWCIT